MDGAQESAPTWYPQSISVSSPPGLVALGAPQVNEEYKENFFRCAKWCPDGGRALGQCEDRSLQLLSLPAEVVQNVVTSIESGPVFRHASPIVDFIWYPGASASNPASYCFLASVRECPIKLFDATDGRLRAGYRIVDHRERQVAPHCLAFNCAASHIYCGYEDAIEVFDLQCPGEGMKIPTTPSKKSRDGMKGIVSSISFCPDYSGLYAASSLSSAIALFSEETGADPVAYLDGMTTPVTQVKFDPARPHILYAAQRRSNEILCWDVREPLEVLRSFQRHSVATNQKLLFDIDPIGRWLATGEMDGNIAIFDLLADSDEPAMRFKAHGDSVGSVAFNPTDSTLLSVSGSRHFDRSPGAPNPSDDLAYSDSSDTESDTSDDDGIYDAYLKGYIRRRRQPIRPYVVDSSAKVWKFSPGMDIHQIDAARQNRATEAHASNEPLA